MKSPFVIALAAAGVLLAQEPRLNLETLVQEALEKNPEVLAAQKRYEAMRQRPQEASSLPDPVLSASYNSSGNPLPFQGLGRQPVANAGLMVSQEFPFPGKRKLRGAIAGREADAEFQQYQMTRLSVVSRLKQAYYRLAYLHNTLEVLERERDLMRQLLRIGEVRYSVGKAAQQDVFKAQMQLSIIETRITRMEQEVRSREAEIDSLLARPPDSPLARPAAATPGPMLITLEELTRRARENAPLLHREEKIIERTELALNLAHREYYPDYTISGGYYYMGSMPAMYMARVDFKLPAYFRRKQRAGVAEQTANVSQARHDYDAASLQVSFRAKDDYLVAEASHRLMDMYSTTVIPQASLALESSLASYQSGTVDFLSVLMNFTAMLDYELSYQEEALNYSQALTRIEEMTGVDVTK
ncbi:MAG: TolC family protein [Bryobacteraceae bacterium]|jgi:outer membrane protein TolC